MCGAQERIISRTVYIRDRRWQFAKPYRNGRPGTGASGSNGKVISLGNIPGMRRPRHATPKPGIIEILVAFFVRRRGRPFGPFFLQSRFLYNLRIFLFRVRQLNPFSRQSLEHYREIGVKS